jgi:VWFA-related protein
MVFSSRLFRTSVVLVLVATLTLVGQVPKTSDYTVSVQVELVALPVSVVDKKDQPFLGLQSEHFRVFEDKVQQDVSLFKQEDVPVSVGLVVDSSGSMQPKQERLIAAALRFARESNPEDETFVVSFTDFPTLEQEFTPNHAELERTLRRVVTNGGTAVYDAVAFAADYLKKGAHEKKILLVITDGEDNASRTTLNEVLEQIKESTILVYTIGLLSPEGMLNTDTIQRARKALKSLAEVTGGQSYFPKSVKDVDALCGRIAHELRSQYTVGYHPSNQNLDGSWRTIKVEVNPPKGTPSLRVRTKRGYYAPTPKTTQAEVASRTRPQ